MGRKKPRFHCKTEAQKKAIRANYAKKAQENEAQPVQVKPPLDNNQSDGFPTEFPFWARLKIGKKRTTLVIDESPAKNKKSNKMEDGFVHREAIHANEDGSNIRDYEKIEPNPDPMDNKPMYLKRPKKTPKRLFEPHNKKLNMPDILRERYDKNNKKE